MMLRVRRADRDPLHSWRLRGSVGGKYGIAVPLKYVVMLFALLQLGLASSIGSLVANTRDAALLTNVIGFQRSLALTLDFSSSLPSQTRINEQKRQENTTARFESVQKALSEGGRVVLPNGDETDIKPLECGNCAPRIAAITFQFADLVAAGKLYAGGGDQGYSSLESLRDQEAALITQITRLVDIVRQDYDGRTKTAVYVVIFAGFLTTAFFAVILFWIRAQLRARIHAASELALLAMNTRNMVMYTTPEQRITWVNDGFTRDTGYSLQEAIGRIPGELLQGKDTDAAAVRGIGTALKLHGSVRNQRLLNYRKDGTPFWVALDVDAVRDENGKIEKFVSVQSDITEQIQQEREVREQAEMERALISAAHNAIIVVDEAGMVELFNPAAETIFGFTSQQMVGQSLDLLLPPAMKGAAHAAMMRGFGSGREESRAMGQRAVKGVRADGSEVPLFASIAKLAHKGRSKFVAILMDVSAHQVAERAIVDRAAAERANAAKTRFLATVSHELRTPLNAISGFAQLAEKKVDRKGDPRLAEFIGAITEATKQLSDLVNDVLDLETIEAGGVSLNLEPLPLRDVLMNCIGLSTPQANSAGIAIEPVAIEPAPVVKADKKRLKQVLDNLLSNAIKYNREGGSIHFIIKVGDGNVVLQIIDTGLGMSPLQLEHLFEPFNRLGAERSAISGTGIGLALVKQIVEVMGGAIEVESAQGQGTTVFVELPLAVPATTTN